MELEVDPRVLTAAKIIGVMVAIALVVWIAVSIWNFIGSALTPPGEKPLTPGTQMQYLNWSICLQKDAIQMYTQTPGSTHPSVVKLKRDISLFDKMAEETGVAKFSLDACAK